MPRVACTVNQLPINAIVWSFPPKFIQASLPKRQPHWKNIDKPAEEAQGAGFGITTYPATAHRVQARSLEAQEHCQGALHPRVPDGGRRGNQEGSLKHDS